METAFMVYWSTGFIVTVRCIVFGQIGQGKLFALFLGPWFWPVMLIDLIENRELKKNYFG